MMTTGPAGTAAATGCFTAAGGVATAVTGSLISIISKSALPTLQSGHSQSSGTSSQRVPAAMPSSGQPRASS
ncbi:hypothetical protein D3C76_1147980 [compost metagenome]